MVATMLIIFLRINWPNLVQFFLLILGVHLHPVHPPAYATGMNPHKKYKT